MAKVGEKTRKLEDVQKEIQSSSFPSESILLDDRKTERLNKSFEMSNDNQILRIKGGGTFVRDIWDILAQAAEEIESLYENRRERSNINRTNTTKESLAPLSRYQTFCDRNYMGSEVLRDKNQSKNCPVTTRDTFETCENTFDNLPASRNNTVSNGTYKTCPSIREFYESSLNKNGNSGKSSNQYVPPPTTNSESNPCKRNITFSSPIRSSRLSEYPQTSTSIPNRFASFDPNPGLASTMTRAENRTPCLRNYSGIPRLSDENDFGFDRDQQWTIRNGSPCRVLDTNDQSLYSPNQTYNVNEKNQNCKKCCQKSMGNQTYDLEDNFIDNNLSNYKDSTHLSRNKTFSNGTFILDGTEVDSQYFDDSQEKNSFDPHPALASTPKKGIQTPPFRNYTDPSMEYSNTATGSQCNSRSNNSSLPRVVRKDAKPRGIQRRVNQTFETPKWTSLNLNDSQP